MELDYNCGVLGRNKKIKYQTENYGMMWSCSGVENKWEKFKRKVKCEKGRSIMASKRRKKKRVNPALVRLIVLCVVIVILLVILIGMLAGEKKNDKQTETTANNNAANNNPTTIEETTTDNSQNETTADPSLPEQTFGKWDLSTLPNDKTPYGNNQDDVTADGIPSGVFWYTSKWSKYNADFISDIGIKCNKGEGTEKIIYLTMDCGFDNEETGPILDILKEKNVKATFFVTSMFYDARPDLIKRMIDEGHRIGSHTINHLDMPTLSLDKQKEEIMDVINKLKKDYNYDSRLFRFPEGSFSDQSLALVNNLGLKSVFWSYAYNDYSSTQPEVQPSYERAVKYVHPGAIYLLHASSSTNRAFLGDWIDAVREKGYEFGGVYPVD